METSISWTDDFLDGMRLQTDPLADETVARIISEEGSSSARELFDLLIRSIEMPLSNLPPAVDDYLEATHSLPDWADREKIALAHHLFLDHGPKFLILLYYKALPILYSDAKGAPVLVKTSRLTNKDESLRIFTRRIAETGQFLMDVMTPGALADEGKGIQVIQKVRLIHAAIRHFYPLSEVEQAQMGQPINQEDMALTLLTFSVELTDGLEQAGISEAEEKIEAYLHAWTAIGSNLGINRALLPGTVEQARALSKTILDRNAAASEAGKLLTTALLDFARRLFSSKQLQVAPEAIIQHFIGAEKAEMLGIKPNYGCIAFLVPELLKSYFRFTERLEDKIDGPLSRFFDELSRFTVRKMVDYFDDYKGRTFHIPEVFQREWLS